MRCDGGHRSDAAQRRSGSVQFRSVRWMIGSTVDMDGCSIPGVPIGFHSTYDRAPRLFDHRPASTSTTARLPSTASSHLTPAATVRAVCHFSTQPDAMELRQSNRDRSTSNHFTLADHHSSGTQRTPTIRIALTHHSDCTALHCTHPIRWTTRIHTPHPNSPTGCKCACTARAASWSDWNRHDHGRSSPVAHSAECWNSYSQRTMRQPDCRTLTD